MHVAVQKSMRHAQGSLEPRTSQASITSGRVEMLVDYDDGDHVAELDRVEKDEDPYFLMETPPCARGGRKDDEPKIHEIEAASHAIHVSISQRSDEKWPILHSRTSNRV